MPKSKDVVSELKLKELKSKINQCQEGISLVDNQLDTVAITSKERIALYKCRDDLTKLRLTIEEELALMMPPG